MRRALVALFGAATIAAGCGSGTVTVAPASVQSFVVTWSIDSLRFGALDCAEAHAVTVDLDLVNLDSGQHFEFEFACETLQGQAGPIDPGHFDVVLDLLDASGRELDEIHAGAENRSQPGTVDLGHFVFQLP